VFVSYAQNFEGDMLHHSAKLKSGAYEIGVEREPGSGGKESAEATMRNLAGHKVFADKVTWAPAP
jgi:hypothetical protein